MQITLADMYQLRTVTMVLLKKYIKTITIKKKIEFEKFEFKLLVRGLK